MRVMTKKEEQHALASPWLHEIRQWEPPQRPRSRRSVAQLEGQLTLDEIEP